MWLLIASITAVDSIVTYETLKENPVAWGWENPLGLVVLPCRQKADWDLNHCCGQTEQLATLSDSEIEETFKGCFQQRSASAIRYAMETCCDNPRAIQRSYDMFGAYVNLATCLRSTYMSNTSSYTSVLDCERSFIPEALDLFAPDIPPKLQNIFMEMHNRLGERLVSATEGLTEDILVKPLSIKDFSLRYALRLLEHLLMPPPILVSQHGQMKFWRAVEQLGAGKLHAKLSSEQRRLRLSKLPISDLPPGEDVVHLAMVASMGQPPFGRKALATLRSALFHAKRKLHFHLFVDKAGRADVEAAMEQNLENWLKLRVAKVDFYMGSDLKEFGRVLNRYVPQGCTSYNQGYGFPSWMRLFPHEIKWKVDIEDLIWVDAGDFLFFADPSLLLDQHKDAVNPETSTVASHPDKEDYAYVFNLPKMRAVQWTKKVGRMIGMELATNQSGGYDELCRQAEVWCMYGMVAKYPGLFATVPGEWSHIPRIPFYNGASQRHRDLRSSSEEAQLWENREHPGVIDPTRAFVFCPSFLDWWTHAMAGLPLPFFAVEVAQAFEHLAMESSFVLNHGHYAESGTYGYQKMNCGRPILGMHLIRQYHVDVPWSLRLLDFWSNVPGLWGGEKKSLPSSASEVD